MLTPSESLFEAINNLERDENGAIIVPAGELPETPVSLSLGLIYLLRTRHFPPVSNNFAGAVTVAGTLLWANDFDQATASQELVMHNGATVTVGNIWDDLHLDNIDWEVALGRQEIEPWEVVAR